jgi:hypothetical protein
MAVAGMFLSGCTTIGPGTLTRDRFDYTGAISDSWENQMLLNLVKQRYGHAPVFLDVASVISQYVLQTQANIGGLWQGPSASLFSGDSSIAVSLGGSGSYTDRPTITYSPLTGEKFARSLMAPIPPAAIMNLIQSGYRVDFIFRVCVQSINGVRNSFAGPSAALAADPEFYPLIEKMRKLQASGDIGMRIHKTKEAEEVRVAFSRKKGGQFNEDSRDVRKLLGIDPDGSEFRVVFGAIASNTKEIALLTRSMLQIMIDLASTIEVPAEHVAERRVHPTTIETTADGKPVRPLVSIHSSPEKPRDAFVTVPYRNHWFWIDDRDILSKNIFSFLMFIFTLTETGSKEAAPIVTIPAG